MVTLRGILHTVYVTNGDIHVEMMSYFVSKYKRFDINLCADVCTRPSMLEIMICDSKYKQKNKAHYGKRGGKTQKRMYIFSILTYEHQSCICSIK